LGVRQTVSDPLTTADVTGGRDLRLALHRELIVRRPGLYSRRFLAARLGVTVRTVQGYHQPAGVKVAPMFLEQLVAWHNVDSLLQTHKGSLADGVFLRDERGKRYPALKQIAVRLLAKDHLVLLVQQTANYYYVGERPPAVSITYGIHPEQAGFDALAAEQERLRDLLRRHRRDERIAEMRGKPPPRPSLPVCGLVLQPPTCELELHLPVAVSLPGAPLKLVYAVGQKSSVPAATADYAHQLADERREALAVRLYVTVNRMTRSAEDRLSLPNARVWVESYDDKLVRHALWLLEHRANIAKPAGFVKTVLRSSASRL
jgi:hypothetical protein